MLPGWRSGWGICHFLRGWSVERYCFFHLSQKVWAKCWICSHWCLWRSLIQSPTGAEDKFTFCVRRVAGVSMNGSSGSVDTGTRGLTLMIATISVESASWVSFDVPSFRNIESKIFLAMPINLSHEPPMWEAWGALNIHLQPWSRKNFSTEVSSILEGILSSLHALTKFGPLLERMSLTGPLVARKRLRARCIKRLDEFYVNGSYADTGE